MFDQQNRKILLRLCLLGILAANLWYFSDSNSTRNYAQVVKQIPIATTQLAPINGSIPVELKCGNANLSGPHEIEDVPCGIINHTARRIKSAALVYSYTFEKNGVTSSEAEVLTMDTTVHPDFRDEHKDNLIPSGSERTIRPLPTSFDDAVVKAISVHIDYVEFEDSSSLGPNVSGSQIITRIREGAAKYRNWLMEKYKNSRSPVDDIAALVHEDQISRREIGIEDGDQMQGATMYRNYVRNIYEAKGADGVAKFLEQKLLTGNK